MIELWYRITDMLLPFGWAHYTFMKNALLAVILVAPVFAVLGTMVISSRMVFFTEVLGHSALAGIAIGVLCGFSDPSWSMLGMAVFLAILVNVVRYTTRASMDTVLGVFMAFMVALGVAILSRQGGFAKYTKYLIGDILTVTPGEIAWIGVIFALVLVYWYAVGNALVLSSVNGALARSRGIRTFLVETSFTLLLAVVVMMSIRLVGILIINSLLVLPAAASRNVTRSLRSYTAVAAGISLLCGVAGLVASYFWDTATGATIVLFAVACYVVSVGGKLLPGRGSARE